MPSPRLADAIEIWFQNVTPPFSNFSHIDKYYKGLRPLRRIFSQARAAKYDTLITERIPAVGYILEENEEILLLHSDFIPGEIFRLSFWDVPIRNREELSLVSPQNFLGYAIIKQDIVPSIIKRNPFHIFESVFKIQDKGNTCVKTTRKFDVRCGNNNFEVSGVLYCQQNGLNKRCAQVALRTLCSCLLPEGDISCSKINEIAKNSDPTFNPKKGLNAKQIKSVLNGLDINFRELDYSIDSGSRQSYPYIKLAYGSIESGWPALVGFSLSGPKAQNEAHIIPFLGHTFNRDTWVPNAEKAYFHVGENTKYLPSESWLDCFIGHDDNFGSNFCLPRQYLDPQNVDYIVTVLPKGYCFDGVIAEATAAHLFYERLPHIQTRRNYWVKQLKRHAGKSKQSIVLRALALTANEYIAHLSSLEDWDGNKEASVVCKILKKFLPPQLWVVELSLPELFPVNCRKLGEMVFHAGMPEKNALIFARIPGQYLIGEKEKMTTENSSLISHTPLAKAFN